RTLPRDSTVVTRENIASFFTSRWARAGSWRHRSRWRTSSDTSRSSVGSAYWNSSVGKRACCARSSIGSTSESRLRVEIGDQQPATMLAATLRQALDTIRADRRWAVLTMFGIIWGTASVVLLVGWGIGVHGMIDRGMQKIGKNLVYVMPGRVGEDLSPADERRTLSFDLDDAEAVRLSARRAELGSAEVLLWLYRRPGETRPTLDLPGLGPAQQELRGVPPAGGRVL